MAPMQIRARQNNVKLTKRLPLDLPAFVKGDQQKLAQVLNNLLSNAVKFTEAGEITVETYVRKRDAANISIEFIVTDTGIGIGEEYLQSIFESFTQAGTDMVRRYGGTGLGLAITKRLIELQGGTILVSSVLGKGTCFRFEIPYAISDKKEEELTLDATKNYTEKQCLKGRQILLVEDNEINQKVTCLHLQKVGLVIEVANNGKEAVEKLEAGKRYDLIIMDLQMPEMNGFQTTMYIRKKLNCATPIIAMTASALRNERIKCFEIGMNEYMTKPFVPADLYLQVERLLVGDTNSSNPSTTIQAQMKEASPYSLAYLEEMEDPEYVVEILKLFLDTTPDMLKTIQEGLIYENWELVHKMAHKLKSSLGILQMNKMLADVAEIERQAHEKTGLDTLPMLISGIIIHYNLVRPMLEADLVRAKAILN
jgi:CheY-like chemotaxis protein